MVARAGKKRVQENEYRIELEWFVDYKEKKVTLSNLFLERAKDMTSEEFKKYMQILNDTKGFELIIINY